jgi:hypothetical protein
MADPPTYPDADNGNDVPGRQSTKATPRWVKVFWSIALVVLLLFVLMMLTGGPGRHGPGRHMSPAGVTERGEQRP